mmetsp:Transcript_4655/g.8125  ORF Transcript_4655/g.8125 Transcript_4655/m.8125 type:complete len:416 (-) Transcript_4655:247-1494(-)
MNGSVMDVNVGDGGESAISSSVSTSSLRLIDFHSVRTWWKSYMPVNLLDKVKCNETREFYERQNELLESYRAHSRDNVKYLSDIDAEFVENREDQQQQLTDDSDPENTPLLAENHDHAHAEKVKAAVIISNVCNFVLLFAQIIAFASSHSLSLMANLIDAVLDLVAGFVVYTAWRMQSSRDKYKYPIGRSRSEPLGVIGMACLMTAATLMTLEQSTQCLIAGAEGERGFVGLSPAVVALVLIALGTKLCLYLFCRSIDDVSAKSLAVDHVNDVISNAGSLTMAFLAQTVFWALDPIGGIVISCLIIYNWVKHTFEHVDNLLGRVASPQFHTIVTFIACNHHPLILKVDTVRCYHLGSGIFCEVDIVLPENLPLTIAHDIGESLQTRIERLEDVERAFVHLDTEFDHSPDIEHKIS